MIESYDMYLGILGVFKVKFDIIVMDVSWGELWVRQRAEDLAVFKGCSCVFGGSQIVRC